MPLACDFGQVVRRLSFNGLGANVRYLTVAPESCLTAIGQSWPIVQTLRESALSRLQS